MKLWQNAIISWSLLPFGSKSEPPLPPPMGRPVREFLKNLLEAEELDDAKVNGRMQTQTALIRADRRVELYAVAAVHLNLAVIVNPRHTEHDLALRLGDDAPEIPAASYCGFASMTGSKVVRTSVAA